jgi:hypothetical protein
MSPDIHIRPGIPAALRCIDLRPVPAIRRRISTSCDCRFRVHEVRTNARVRNPRPPRFAQAMGVVALRDFFGRTGAGAAATKLVGFSYFGLIRPRSMAMPIAR